MVLWNCIPNMRYGDAHCAELATQLYMYNTQCCVCRQYQRGDIEPRYQLPAKLMLEDCIKHRFPVVVTVIVSLPYLVDEFLK